MALTALADQKANIVLGLAFLTISLSATRLAQNDTPPALLVLLISAIVAGLFALAALLPRPSVAASRRTGTGDESSYNPLFFAAIASVDYPQYLAQMCELMRSNEAVYGAIVADLHSGARALSGKYRWLRCSYFAIVIGLASSGLALLLQIYAGTS